MESGAWHLCFGTVVPSPGLLLICPTGSSLRILKTNLKNKEPSLQNCTAPKLRSHDVIVYAQCIRYRHVEKKVKGT